MIHAFVVIALFLQGALANWWLLAMPSANQLISQISPQNLKEQCFRIPRSLLPEPRQRELCTLSENMLMVVSVGAKMALLECQNQFSSRRWNCSTSFKFHNTMHVPNDVTLPQDSKKLYHSKFQNLESPQNFASKAMSNMVGPSQNVTTRMSKKEFLKKTKATGRMLADLPLDLGPDALPKSKSPPKPPQNLDEIFGGVLNFDSREKAYVHSISAAGVAFSITRACRNGRLPACKCDPRKRSHKPGKERDWEWGGCSDHVRYGERISKDFVDAVEMSQWIDPAKRLMNLHNNEAGRRSLRRSMSRACKCHGISGSCTLKVCWRQLKNFAAVGEFLRRKFDGATRVVYRRKRHRLTPAAKDIKRPTKKDLVYLEESPDYCHPDPVKGIVGTKGRLCNRASYGMDGCLLMCCGRGYTTEIVEEVNECNCKFEWCCKVVCEKCHVKTVQHRCN